MKKSKVLLLVTLPMYCLSLTAVAQEKWDLRRCVEYALANNLSVQQSNIQAQLADVSGQQAHWQQYPNADFNTNTGLQWGRSIDPTTNQFTSNQLLYQSFSLSASVVVFNWNRIRNSIIAADLSSDAARTDVEKMKNDISLNVATYFLQVLLARQQQEIAAKQMGLTREQLEVTRKKVTAGALPELDALTLEGQYATDSASYITAVSNADQNLLQLKQVLNIDAGKPFDIANPPADQIPVEPILQLQPETVFEIALQNQPAQKANTLRIKSLEATLKADKANMYPTIAVGGSLGSNFSSANKKITDASIVGFDNTGYITNVGGIQYPVLSPSVAYTQKNKTFGERWDGWGTQVNNNFRQSLGLSIAVPINSGGTAKYNYQRSKLNLKNATLTQSLADQTLKNDIYKAYYSAAAAMEKYNASKISVAVTQKALDFAEKRRALGLLNTYDYILSLTNFSRAQLDLTSAQFDYVFKMKVLEFYKGQGIKL